MLMDHILFCSTNILKLQKKQERQEAKKATTSQEFLLNKQLSMYQKLTFLSIEIPISRSIDCLNPFPIYFITTHYNLNMKLNSDTSCSALVSRDLHCPFISPDSLALYIGFLYVLRILIYALTTCFGHTHSSSFCYQLAPHGSPQDGHSVDPHAAWLTHQPPV